jgi:hypothetical protein
MMDPLAMVSTIETRRNDLASQWQILQLEQAQLESESQFCQFRPTNLYSKWCPFGP